MSQEVTAAWGKIAYALASNQSYFFVGSILRSVPEEVCASVRQPFGIPREEQILLVCDTSPKKNRNQGLIITDEKLYCIPDNEQENSGFCFSWKIITRVEYHELSFLFYEIGDDSPWQIPAYWIIRDENTRDWGPKLTSVFQEMAEAARDMKDLIDYIFQKIDEYWDVADYEGCVRYIVRILQENKHNQYLSGDALVYLFQLIISRTCDDEAERSIQFYNEALDYFNSISPYSLGRLYQLRAQAEFSLSSGSFLVQRKYHWLAYQTESDWIVEVENEGEQPIWKYCQGSVEAIDNLWIKEEFADCLSYQERKLLLPVKDYTTLDVDNIWVMRMDRLPDLYFPIGHPQAGQLYVAHPLLEKKYMPFETYQLELVEDRVRELCMLAQHLGATEIAIECLNATQEHWEMQQQASGQVQGGVKLLKGEVSGSRRRSLEMAQQLSQRINLHQHFEPTAQAHLPEGMVWYEQEPSWQRLYQQRMNGGLLYHEERLETQKSQLVNSQEMKKVAGELQYLFASVSGETEQEFQERYAVQENVTLSVKIHFAPLSQLTGEMPQKAAALPAPQGYTASEQEYMEEVRECLSEGELSPRTRRLLERLRISLNISPERAQELEASMSTPFYTEEEAEYVEELRECLAEGELSPRTLRLLDKIRVACNISPERAQELENFLRG